MRLFNPGQRFFVIDYETTGLDMVKSEPIEVGIVVCDDRFQLVESYSSLIQLADGPVFNYGREAMIPYRIHGIAPGELDAAPTRKKVADDVSFLARKHTNGGSMPVLVSDNIQFEWQWTKTLLGDWTWPFHYCGWDSSLLLEAAGVGDPKPAHRALADAGLLHAAIVKALDRLRHLAPGVQ